MVVIPASSCSLEGQGGSVATTCAVPAADVNLARGKCRLPIRRFPSKEKLSAVIETLIAAVRAGELDELFHQAAKTGSIGKARKAA